MAFFKQLSICFSLFFKFIRVGGQVFYGSWKVSKLPQPVVSIFGGARFDQKDFYAEQAHQLAQSFVARGVSVLTGGGPGIMEAANCGVFYANGQHKGKTMGIGVKDLGEEGPNHCVQEYFELDYFFARKWLLTHYSVAFVVFPGGFGTLDELAEVLTLIQTNKLKRVPIVLIGTEFWEPFFNWVIKEALKHKTVSQKDVDLLILTDDLDQALSIIANACGC